MINELWNSTGNKSAALKRGFKIIYIFVKFKIGKNLVDKLFGAGNCGGQKNSDLENCRLHCKIRARMTLNLREVELAVISLCIPTELKLPVQPSHPKSYLTSKRHKGTQHPGMAGPSSRVLLEPRSNATSEISSPPLPQRHSNPRLQ